MIIFSAGIGRTGTFCISHGNLMKLRMLLWTAIKEPFDIKKGTLRIRQQRAGMIQTKEQYLFCYLALRDWYQQN
jgi:protein tyrosine phosphatase